MKKFTRLLILCCLILTTACLSDSASTDDALKFDEIKTQIRERFPTVNQLSITEYKKIADQPNGLQLILLDVREADEYQVSHIKGAKLSTDLDDALRILDGVAKDVKIVTYCSVGYRSSKLAKGLAERGFTNVSNMEGSIFEWANRGLPVFRSGKQVEKVHPYDSTWGELLKEKYRSR